MNRNQVLNGYFYECEYHQWDNENKTFKTPKKIRYKQNDEGTQGVSSGGRHTRLGQPIQGRPQTLDTYTIKVLEDLPYKPMDGIKTLNDGVFYTVKEVFKNETNTNNIKNLRQKTVTNNKQYVLVLGEKN